MDSSHHPIVDDFAYGTNVKQATMGVRLGISH